MKLTAILVFGLSILPSLAYIYGCQDISSYCGQMEILCDTDTYIQERCRKTCGLCGRTPETPTWKKINEIYPAKIPLRGQVNVSLSLESHEEFSPVINMMGNSLSLSWKNGSVVISRGAPLPKGSYEINIYNNPKQTMLTVNPSKYDCQASFTNFGTTLDKLKISSKKGTFYTILNLESNAVFSQQKNTSECDCGVSSISAPGLNIRKKREIGGEDADAAEYPWQAYILLDNEPDCGGSIINKNWVLSAAHCFWNERLNNMTLKLGFEGSTSYNNSDINIMYNAQDIEQNLLIHPKYNSYTFTNDVALIRLKQELTWTPYVKPICLAAPEDIRPGQKAISTGFGWTDYYGDLPFTLQEVVLDVISLTHCKSLYSGINSRRIYIKDKFDITDNMICAYTEGKDSCYGDSGGPLITQLDNGRWTQIGIVSFGYGCAKKDSPGVYTNVPNYRTWIDQVTGSYGC